MPKRKSPDIPGPYDRLVPRLSETDDGCWIHERPHPNGYAYIGHRYRKILAHRFMYEEFIAPIPHGLQLDHLCRRPACVNPWHMEPVTGGENVRRGSATGRRVAVCPHGHEYTDENTYVTPKGLRVCRACKRIRDRRSSKR